MLKITANETYKLMPIYYDGALIPRRIMKFIFFNGKIYYTEDKMLISLLMNYLRTEEKSKLHIGTRYFYNIYKDKSVDSIMFSKSIDDIISKDPELLDINSNAHLCIIEDEFIYSQYLKDYSKSHKINIDWKKPDPDIIKQLIIDNSNKINNIIIQNTLNDINILGEDFTLIYRNELANNRDKKIEKLIKNLS